MPEITIGSHLTTPRIGYQHHGIYIGNNRVIHLTSHNRIEIVSLDTFTDGNGYSNNKFNSKYSRQEIIERARSRLGNHDYSVVFNNCEHFINWCIHGKHRSKQVQSAVSTVGVGVVGITARSLITQAAPTLVAEIATVSGSTSSFALLSTTPVIPAALVGYGVYKAFKWLSD